MISYAENGEDVILRRVFPDARGFYVDVGAGFPTVMSVTKHFYDQGWRGVNIEPHKGMFTILKKARPRDVNLDCAVGTKPGQAAMSHFSDTFGLSTLSSLVADRHHAAGLRVSRSEVVVRTLDDILERHAKSRRIDFVKIDVEGSEKEVLRSFDLARWKPKVLVIESTIPTSPEPSYGEWEGIVTRAGYQCALFDGLNRYYARKNDEKLLTTMSLPSNPFDSYVPFKWWGLVPPHLRWQYIKRMKARGKKMHAFERLEKQWLRIRKEFKRAWGYDV